MIDYRVYSIINYMITIPKFFVYTVYNPLRTTQYNPEMSD